MDDGWWKEWVTLVSSTPSFRKEILPILVGAFSLSLDIVGLNIVDSVIHRAREYQWKYI